MTSDTSPFTVSLFGLKPVLTPQISLIPMFTRFVAKLFKKVAEAAGLGRALLPVHEHNVCAEPLGLALNRKPCVTGAVQGPGEAAAATGGESGAHVGAQIPAARQVAGLGLPAAPTGCASL